MTWPNMNLRMLTARRRSPLVLPFAVCLALSLFATSCDLPLPPIGSAEHRNVLAECDVEVFVLRGFADVYSLGFNHLNARLQNEGLKSVVMNHIAWPSIGQAILDSRDSGVLGSRLAAVGHSFGGDDAIHLAEMLRPHGIELDLIVLFDSTNPPPVPDNVGRVVHFYQRTPWGDLLPDFFAGQKVRAAPGNERTEILNVMVDAETLGEAALEVNHFNMDSSSMLHDLTVEEIMGLCIGAPMTDSMYGL